MSEQIEEIFAYYGKQRDKSSQEMVIALLRELQEAERQELQIMCVLYTEDVGGILLVVYDEEGNLELKVEHEENDFAFDEIGSVLKIKQLQQTKRELFESLETFYRVFYLGEE